MTIAGQQDDGTYVISYSVSGSQGIPIPADPQGPTPEEQQAIQAYLRNIYYRPGDQVTIVLPDIPGYITPEPTTRTFTLSANPEENHHNIVYLTQAEVDTQNNQDTTPSVDTTTSGGLASTGVSIVAISSVAVVLVLGSLAVIFRQKH